MEVSAASFEWVRSLLARRAGNALPADKSYLVAVRLTPLALSAGADDVDALIDRLRSVPDFELERQIVEAMLTHESSFFRDEPTFEMLASRILPELIKKRRDQGQLTIWSAACAAGQEPYSLAMLIHEQFPILAGWEVRIVATDFSRRTLAQARTGAYTDIQMQRGLSLDRKRRFFREEHRHWRISDELLDSVEFSTINLCNESPPLPQFDLILLRNVLIYMTDQARQQVLSQVAQVLAPDGRLILGASESLDQASPFHRETGLAMPCYRLAE